MAIINLHPKYQRLKETEPNFKSFEIDAIVLAILLYLFRATIPVLKFPFLLLFFGLLFYCIIIYKKQIFGSLKVLFKYFYLTLILLIFYTVSFLISKKLFLVIFKDISNAGILVILFYLLIILIKSSYDLERFCKRMIFFILIYSVLISLLLLTSFLNLFHGYYEISSDIFARNSVLGSLSADYNFALIPIFFGIVIVIYFLNDYVSNLRKIFYNSYLIIFTLAIFFSGSRRGLITLAIIILFLIFIQILSVFKNRNTLILIGLNARYFLVTIVLFTFLIFGFTFHASYSFKNKSLELLGSKDIVSTKNKFALAVFRYYSIFNKEYTYNEIYDQIWFHDFDKALDPDNGLATTMYKTIFPLSGKNVNIVPSGTIGYLMDFSSKVYTMEDKAYSYTLLGATSVTEGSIVQASVYCYVSKDFNGGDVKLFSEGSALGDVETKYEVFDTIPENDFYTNIFFNKVKPKSGSLFWFNNSTANLDHFNYTTNENNHTFLSVKSVRKDIKSNSNSLFFNGNFKYGLLNWNAGADSTKHEIITTPFGQGIRITRTNGDGGSWSLYYTGRPIIYYADHSYKLSFKYKVEKGSALPFNIGWWINNNVEKGFSTFALPLVITPIKGGWQEATAMYKFKNTFYNLPTFLNSLQDNSTVNITDIELIDMNKVDSLPVFVDEINEMDQNKKGVWQKLTLRTECNKGIAAVYLYFSKKGVTDFSALKGYVIFANPKYEILDPDVELNSLRKKDKNTLLEIKNNYYPKVWEFPLKRICIKELLGILRTQVPNSYKTKTDYQIKNLIETKIKTKTSSVKSSFLLSVLPFFELVSYNNKENDPIRKWASRFISEDTTYYGNKKDLLVFPSSHRFLSDRVIRWQFAWQIFAKEYSWKQKIFGGGFNFLNWFGYRFLKDKTASDYPHNPLLSVLLYSGLIGLIIYLLFLYKAIYYYIKYLREYPILAIFFIITFFFSFFSAGSPFDPPIMGFFMILPFFIHHVHKNSEPDKL